MHRLKHLQLESSNIAELEMLDGGRVCYALVITAPHKDSLIRTQIWLPENYNGRFLGLGSGGQAGCLADMPIQYLEEGYAVATTDMGTSQYVSGEKTRASKNLYADYAHLSTHLMATIAKACITAYYGEEPKYSYFFGQSAGGLQGYSEVQYYPEDFDGVIAGVPSNNALHLILYFLWLHIKLRREDGTSRISASDAKEISVLAAEFFQSRGDGEAGDRFITYPYTDENTVTDFLAFLEKRMKTLSKEQLSVLKEVYDGPKHPHTGEQLFCGLPLGAEVNCGYFSEGANFGFFWFRLFFGEGYDDRNFSFDTHYEQLLSAIGKDFTANNPDLSAFASRGGKFLTYSGTEDASGPWADAMKYYNRVCAAMGGYENAQGFYKHFVLPGRGHGERGRGLFCPRGRDLNESLLSALRGWREEGIAPEYLLCAHYDTNEDGTRSLAYTRKIFPYRGDKTREGIDFPKTTSDRILAFLDTP
jgi:feruloyl esterase